MLQTFADLAAAFWKYLSANISLFLNIFITTLIIGLILRVDINVILQISIFFIVAINLWAMWAATPPDRRKALLKKLTPPPTTDETYTLKGYSKKVKANLWTSIIAYILLGLVLVYSGLVYMDGRESTERHERYLDGLDGEL